MAFTKMQARRLEAEPVWYTDSTWATDWRVRHVWNLIEERKNNGTFLDSDIAQIAPFIERMGYVSGGAGRKEFWWEREWRHFGDIRFAYSNVALALCPEERIDEFEALMGRIHAAEKDSSATELRFIDPRWGLEEIIARLAGVSSRDLSPFSA